MELEVKVPPDKILIPEDKITNYLLVSRPRNDKSKFLAQAGFTLEKPDMLETAIRDHAVTFEAVTDRADEYGRYFRIEGPLTGPNGSTIAVVTIRIQRTDEAVFRFVS